MFPMEVCPGLPAIYCPAAWEIAHSRDTELTT